MQNIFAIAALALAAPVLAGEIPASELSISGVASGASEANVLRHLGQPLKRVDAGEGIELIYPELVVTIGWLEQQAPGVPRRVIALHGTGPSACTPSGLCPGMPTSEAVRLYGAAKQTKRSYGTFLEYQPQGLSCWLQVSAPRATVESVGVACQP